MLFGSHFLPPCSCPSVAGGSEESVQQPVWSADGNHLYFISDSRAGWWNIFAYNIKDGSTSCVLEKDADFGFPQWLFGNHSYELIGDSHILAVYKDPAVPGGAGLHRW